MKHFQIFPWRLLRTSGFFLSFITLLISCGKKESELAKQIVLETSGPEFVLPNPLQNTETLYFTCLAAGSVQGPRVRVRYVKITWTGPGNLLPLLLRWRSQDQQLESEFQQVLAPEKSGTIAGLFGLATDYIPEGNATVSTEDSGAPGTSIGSRCYFDMGGLPKLKKTITGGGTVKVRGKLTLSAIQELPDGTQTPVVKETDLDVLYFEGSAPLD